MDRIIDETWLTRLVDTFGSSSLKTIYDTIYSSDLFKCSLIVFLTMAIISVGVGINRGHLSTKGLYAAMVYVLLYPVGHKPAAFFIINTLGVATRQVFEQGVTQVVSGFNNSNSSLNTMPPGIVMEMIVDAATEQIGNQATRKKLAQFAVHCLPHAICQDGSHATFEDAFDYSIRRVSTANGDPHLIFSEKRLEPKSLLNTSAPGGGNCADLLNDIREELDKNSESKGPLVNRVLEHRSEGLSTTNQAVRSTKSWFNQWKASSAFPNVAKNLAIARAASYEQSKLIKDFGNNVATGWYQRSGTDASLREMLGAYGGLPSTGYHLSDAKDILSNLGEARWSVSLGAAVKDLKEKIELMPYNLAAIRLLLLNILPFVMLTVFFQNFRFLSTWAGAWITTLLLPAIVSASRSMTNAIILSKLGIENLSAGAEGGYKSLAHGVNLTVAKVFLDDFVPLGFALINQELAIITALSGCMLAGGWLAGGSLNNGVSAFANTIQNTVTSALASKGIGLAVKGLGAAATAVKSLPAVSGARASGSQLATGAMLAVRNASPSVQNSTDTGWRLPPRGGSETT